MAERVLDGPLRAVVWSRSHEHRDLYGIVLGVVPFGVVLLQAYLLATPAEIPVPGLRHEPLVMFPWSPSPVSGNPSWTTCCRAERSRGRSKRPTARRFSSRHPVASPQARAAKA
jgi:hypothetical protein